MIGHGSGKQCQDISKLTPLSVTISAGALSSCDSLVLDWLETEKVKGRGSC